MAKSVFPNRAARGEKVGGGFIVFRRHRSTNRVATPASTLPFEHGSFEAAEKEMNKLAKENPGKEFCVFYQVTSAKT